MRKYVWMLVSNLSGLTIGYCKDGFFFLTDHFEVSTLRHPQMLCLAVHIQQHCLSQTSISWRWTIISCANALKTTSSIKGGLHVVHLSRVIQHFLLMKHEQHPHSQNDTLAALAEAPSLDDLVWCKQEPFFMERLNMLMSSVWQGSKVCSY